MATLRLAKKAARRPTSARGVFVTGTDTGAGKTLVSAAIVRALVLRGYEVGVYKPAETGCRPRGGPMAACDVVSGGAEQTELIGEDGELLAAAARRGPARRGASHVCSYLLRQPAAPLVAAEAEGVTIEPELLIADFTRIAARSDFVLVEGAGGLLVPLAEAFTYRDLARELALPLVCVVASRLGCINHALLTFEAIAAAGLGPFGYVVNQLGDAAGATDDARSNRSTIARFARARDALDLGLFPFVAEPERADLDALAALAEASLDLDAISDLSAKG